MEVRFHNGIDELNQILTLQAVNHRAAISQEEYMKEGFVTIKHALADLQIICGKYGHTVAIDNNKIIGYALTMLSNYHHQIPGLGEMVEKISGFAKNNNFLIMGQVCIDKRYRGKGVFALLYDHMRLTLSPKYPGIYTEIDEDNPRSLRAHEKVGFDIILQYHNRAGKLWNLVYWDWKS